MFEPPASFEALLLQNLATLQTSIDRNFDLLVAGQKSLHEKFEAHEKSDAEQFESIRTEMATSKANDSAVAEAHAKFWAGIGSFVSLILGSTLGILGDYLLFGRNK